MCVHRANRTLGISVCIPRLVGRWLDSALKRPSVTAEGKYIGRATSSRRRKTRPYYALATEKRGRALFG